VVRRGERQGNSRKKRPGMARNMQRRRKIDKKHTEERGKGAAK
jgi:hypothetical protein